MVAYEIFRENAAEAADTYPEPAFMELGLSNTGNSSNRLCNGMTFDGYGAHLKSLQNSNSKSPDRTTLLDSDNFTRIRLVQFQKNTDEPMVRA